jgi:site-specific DNA-methyltransferase (adenine-specific)
MLNKVCCVDWEIGIKNIKDKSVDLVLSDPPYGMEYNSNHRKVSHKVIKNDDNLDWLGTWVSELKRVCKDEAHLYIFCSWHNIDIFKQEISKSFNIKNILIWEKNNHGSGDLLGDYAPKYEMIIFCSNGEKKLNGNRIPNIIKADRTNNEKHPTEKPIKLLKLFIEKSSDEGDIVLDTFSGSFSTAKAAKMLNRNFIAFEIEEDYCNAAEEEINRIKIYEKLF